MRVLLLSESPINRQYSIGNTFLDVFEGVGDAELYSFFTRSGMPDMSVIKKAFRISDKRLLKYCLFPKKTGEVIEQSNTDGNTVTDFTSLETFVKQKRPSLLLFMRTCMWKLMPWRLSGYLQFVSEINPDVIFAPFTNSVVLNDIILYTKKHSSASLFVYAWDDTYGYGAYSKNIFSKLCQFVRRRSMRKIVSLSDKMYVISDAQKNDYEKAFSRECKVLTKSGYFDKKPEYNADGEKPLKMLYAGNLGIDRWKTVGLVANAVKEINSEKKMLELHIYSGTPLTEKQIDAISVSDSSFFHGSVSASEVERLQAESDIMLFAEDFSQRSIDLIHHSFSTKLVDLFSAAKPIFAVGPVECASISHLVENDAAVVCSDKDGIKDRLYSLVAERNMLNEYSQKAFDCGKKNHDKKVMSEMLHGDLVSSLNQ